MVNQSLSPTHRNLAEKLLLFAILSVWGWCGMGWSGQVPVSPASKPAPSTTTVQKPSAPATTKQVRSRRGKAPAERPSEVSAKRAAPVIAGRRDPFKVPPPPSSTEGEITGPLPPGNRGLVISLLKLEGIVRFDKTNEMIAVVTNYTKRAYFLRVNDAVYNGVVSKITPDSITFQENYLAANGRVSSREVSKRLGSAPGEGR